MLRRLAAAIAAACAAVLAACTPLVAARGLNPSTPELRQDGFVTRDGLVLGLTAWQAQKPAAIIVALHGMNDYSKFIRMPAAHWQGQGITTYAIDQRGFGRSPQTGIWGGTEAMTDDAIDLIAAVRARHPGTPLYVLGESMGGAVAVAALARPDAPKPDGLILVAPAAWGWSTMNFWYRAALWLSAHGLPEIRFTGSSLTITPSDNREVLVDLGRDPLVIKPTRTDAIYGLVKLMQAALDGAPRVNTPTLVLYGMRDEIVPRYPVQRLVESLGRKPRVGIYARGYHLLLRDLQREAVWSDIAGFIAGAPGPLASGAEVTAEAFAGGAPSPQNKPAVAWVRATSIPR